MQVPPTPTLLEGMNRLVAEQLGKREGEKVEAKKKSWKRADPLKEFIGKVANVLRTGISTVSAILGPATLRGRATFFL